MENAGAATFNAGVTSTGMVVSNSSGATINVNTAGAGVDAKILLHETSTASSEFGASLKYSGANNRFEIGTGQNAETSRLQIDRDTGNVRFNPGVIDSDFTVSSDGYSHMLHVDGGTNRFGLGSSSVDNFAHFKKTTLVGRPASNGNTILTLEHATDTGIQFFSATQTQLRFGDASDTGSGAIIYTHSDNTLRLSSNGSHRFTIGGTTALSIDSSQNVSIPNGELLVGKSNTTFSTTGIELRDGNGGSRFIRSNAEPILMNRTGSDGKVLGVYKDGNEVGSIATSSSTFQLGQGNVNLKFANATDTITPANLGGSDNDNALSLGKASARFSSLYLAGGVFLGGTGAANKLDDYEEGTWTPVIKDGGSTTISTTNNQSTYTKIGRFVMVSAMITRADTASLSGILHITNLPFAVKAGDTNISGGVWFDRASATDTVTTCYIPGGGSAAYPKKVGDNSNYATSDDFEHGRPLYMSAMYHST
jgi:hypothetical protein